MSRTVIFHRLAAPTGASVKRRTVWLPAIFAILVLADAWAVSDAPAGGWSSTRFGSSLRRWRLAFPSERRVPCADAHRRLAATDRRRGDRHHARRAALSRRGCVGCRVRRRRLVYRDHGGTLCVGPVERMAWSDVGTRFGGDSLGRADRRHGPAIRRTGIGRGGDAGCVGVAGVAAGDVATGVAGHRRGGRLGGRRRGDRDDGHRYLPNARQWLADLRGRNLHAICARHRSRAAGRRGGHRSDRLSRRLRASALLGGGDMDATDLPASVVFRWAVGEALCRWL